MSVNGLQNFSEEIARLGGKGRNMCKYALYGGAEAITDAIRENISSVPVETNHYVNTGNYITNQKVDPAKPPSFDKVTVSPEILAELQKGLGISRMKCGGKVEVVIGFAGYSSITTKKYSGGIPLQMIARSIESGSSVREKHPFVRPAVNKARSKAQDAMQRRAEKYISDFFNKE